MNKNNRTSNSIKNIFFSVFIYILTTIIGFIFQSIFIKTLGAEYNGVKSLFSNIFNMLSIAELGFGSAIVFNLYKPVAEEDCEKIRSLVKFYKIVYNIIAGIILILGMILIPVIPNIVGNTSVPENIRFLFILYLINTVFSYLLTYKRSILYADQKEYITNIVDSSFSLIRQILQIGIILVTKNFILYLVIQIIITILNNWLLNYIVNRKYIFLKDLKNVKPIDNDIKNNIFTNVKGLLFHKIGGIIVMGTDNIIISMTKNLGILYVGLYSNYNMIIQSATSLFKKVITSLTASVGNLLIENNKLKSRNIYKSILLFNSWIFCFGVISIYCLIEPFIKLWIGDEFILPKFVLITLMVNVYVQGIRNTTSIFKDAAGIFYKDRYIPLIEAIINLISSIILVRIFGLSGIFMGTIISSLFLIIYSYPKYVYKLILDGEYSEFFKLHLYHLSITLGICLITGYISSLIIISNVWLKLIFNGIICLIIPNLLYYLITRNSQEFKFYSIKIKEILTKKIKKNFV